MSSSDEKRIPRRELLRGTLTFGLAAIGTSALAAACGKSTPKVVSCEDTTGLKPDEIEQRKTLAYTDKSPEPQKSCDNCNQYIAPPKPDDACGGCKILKGYAAPKGYCKSWVAKTPA